jgi:hypothetical protein
MKTILTLATIVSLGFNLFSFKEDVPFEAISIEQRAEMAGMELDEFILISSVTEAESNRCTDSTEGRRYIALCILCRVMDSRFPDTITEVLTQSGQFSTVRNGHSVTQRTDLSDLAVIEAVEWIESGEENPWVLFFNCRYYFSGYTAYGCIGGNYFSVAEPMIEEAEHGT